MTAQLIGYFPKCTMRRASGWNLLPAGVEELCNVACASPEPANWTELWLHNEMWAYDTEVLAWAVATDLKNLRRLTGRFFARADLQPGLVDQDTHDYVARHVVLPNEETIALDEWFDWDLYAYRLFPLRFVAGQQEPFQIPLLNTQPLSGAYQHLGYDLVSRSMDNVFEHSPLWCNGWWNQVAVNRYCLLEELDGALRLAKYFSDGHTNSSGAYVGPAEPGPYFVAEVLRRRFVGRAAEKVAT